MRESPPVATRRQFARFTGLSTGVRMLIILTTARRPRGLIALFAAIRSAESNRRQHERDAGIIAAQAAQQIDQLIARDARLVRTFVDAAVATSSCADLLAATRTAIGEPDARYAFYDPSGRRRCASDRTLKRAPAPRSNAVDVLLLEEPAGLRFTVKGGGDAGYATGDLPLAAMRRAVHGLTRAHGAVLLQGGVRLNLADTRNSDPLDQRVRVTAPLANGQVALAMTVNIARVTAIEVLLVLLPMLMWLAGAIIGWAVVERLLLKPLAELEEAVSGYRAGGGGFRIPRLTTPSHEIRNLAEAFRNAAEDQAGHETELEEGLARQTKLTREVHHRVKNNLQVVASLINLHARGTGGDVAAAYASIQRRVDALAVVHRNHYAEMEDNKGINLRTLIAELAANLRGSAPGHGGSVGVTIDMQPAWVNQDVAVPVSFLFTEIFELVLDCAPSGSVALMLVPTETPTRMRLSIEAPRLSDAVCLEHPGRDRFHRIVEGLSRQLRSPLRYDSMRGRYEIDVPVLEKIAEG